MKKFLFFLLLLMPISCYAVSDSSYSSIVMDMNSHRVLYSNNSEEVRSVASISNIMTT